MITLTAQQIADITGGVLHNIDPGTQVVGPAEFDSRAITPGCIFIALPGARVDGHTFATAAVKDGAALVLASRVVDAPCCVVEPLGPQSSNSDVFAHDPDGAGAAVLAALGSLARHTVEVLAEDGLMVIGLTGSAGKTSTKDMLATVLRTSGPTVAPRGSFNNEIGHPYTALQVTRDTKFLVAEMSARGVGHIAHLATFAPPRIGVVLNVGSAHVGEFGSRETIAQAKGELVEALPAAEAGGVAVLNADDGLVVPMRERTDAAVLTFSASCHDADIRATDIALDDLSRASFTLLTPAGVAGRVRLQVFGIHQVDNALAAAAAARAAGISDEAIVMGLNNHTAVSAHRMDVQVRTDGLTVINDSYNANPESMRAGIDALSRTAAARGGRAIAVLGEMGELGDTTETEHQKLAAVLARRGVHHLVAVGDTPPVRALLATAEEAGITSVSADEVDAAVQAVTRIAQPKDVVLVKASYAGGLWRVAEGLLAAEEHNEGAQK